MTKRRAASFGWSMFATLTTPAVMTIMTGMATVSCTESHDIWAPLPDVADMNYSFAGRGNAGSGNNGQAGAPGNAGVPEVLPDGAVACGSAVCTPPASPLGAFGVTVPTTAAACCVDADLGACGVTSTTAGAACEPLAVSDPRCPGLDLSGLQESVGGQLGSLVSLGSATMFGCCINDACGQDGAMFGRGCIENGEAKATLSAVPLIGSFAEVPDAISCSRAGASTLINLFTQLFPQPQG